MDLMTLAMSLPKVIDLDTYGGLSTILVSLVNTGGGTINVGGTVDINGLFKKIPVDKPIVIRHTVAGVTLHHTSAAVVTYGEEKQCLSFNCIMPLQTSVFQIAVNIFSNGLVDVYCHALKSITIE